MNSDDKFWLGVWSVLGTAVVSVSLISGYYMHKNDLIIKEMVAKGTPAIEIPCAFYNARGNLPICITIATTRGE